MGDCLKALQESQGRYGERLRRPAQARHGVRRQEGVAHHQRGCGRHLHPRRAAKSASCSSSTASPTSSPAPKISRSSSATSPCTLPPPTRATSAAKKSPSPTLTAKRTSSSPSPRCHRQAGAVVGQDRRRQDGEVLRRSLPARSALHQGSSPDDLAAHCHQGRQARRKHLRPPLRPLQGRRPNFDCGPGSRSFPKSAAEAQATEQARQLPPRSQPSPGDSPGSFFCSRQRGALTRPYTNPGRQRPQPCRRPERNHNHAVHRQHSRLGRARRANTLEQATAMRPNRRSLSP